MDAVVKGWLYLAGILLLGAGVTSRFVAASIYDSALARHLRLGVLVGGTIVIVGSIANLLLIVHGVLGYLDAPLVQNYLANTRHGRATLVRISLVVVVVAITLLSLRRRPSTAGSGAAGRSGWRVSDALFVLAGVTLLGTFSWTSHAAAMGGTPPLLADLVHFGAATVWAGPIIYLALYPHWSEQRPALKAAFRRVSMIGLVSVLLLFITGGYTALIHIQSPERFVSSPYGWALGVKLLVVAIIVAIAAANRLWLLPAFLSDDRSERFRNAVKAEAVLLVAAFVLTGVLTTSALPHEPGSQATALENLVNFVNYLMGR